MAGKQAKILSTDQVQDLLWFADQSRYPARNRVMVLLSVKAGLRAAEIANLTWDMVIDGGGEISSSLELRDSAAKMNHGRLIPLHSDLRDALALWRDKSKAIGPVIRPDRGGPMTPLSIVI